MSNLLLERINPIGQLTDLPYSVFVMDRAGQVLISNYLYPLTMGITLEEILNSNVYDLVEKGYYDKSTAARASETKNVVEDVVTTRIGVRVRSISTPIIGESGEVSLIITESHLLEAGDYTSGEKSAVKQLLKEEYSLLQKQSMETDGIIAESLSMKRILQVCSQVAKFDSKVLLYGESGTGKEVLARFIHRTSHRKENAFVPINCSAIPESLFESELFGHEKGSFTGAVATKKGIFDLADGGTLFLDEIGEMPLEVQAKLLRVLETNEYRRVGGTETLTSNFRLICATNKDLQKMVKSGEFRGDLYFRINVIHVEIPPLRKRKADILALASNFLSELCEQYSKRVSLKSSHLNHLMSHEWPGNVRELKNYMERIFVREGTSIKLTQGQVAPNQILSVIYNQDDNLKEFLAKAEKIYIDKVLEECKGKVTKASSKLGIHRSVLYRKLKNNEEQKKA